ncbi:hypothetical protein [Desulfonatronospira sp.]|uniref:hypothetical protein n=1 Tax=Desulfonatronospira sp. TaxID=1962951 RepID=UPI0025C6BC2D|nr:hypothetical protein [Desulfonatronospira sp.]
MNIFGPGYRESSKDESRENPRVRSFRRRYSPGEIIRGTVLEYDTTNMAWVLVDDLRVLAWIRDHHFRGRLLHLQVESMHPEIVLKEVELDPDGRKRFSIVV